MPELTGTKHYINILYTYNRASHQFPTGVTVEAKFWDVKKFKVIFRCPESAEFNQKIDKVFQSVEAVCKRLVELEREPTVDAVKDVYAQSVEFNKLYDRANEIAKPINIARAQEHRTKIEELEEEIRILRLREQKNLRWAGLLNDPTPYVEKPVKPIMLEMLEEYVLFKTKTPLFSKVIKTTGTTRQIRTWANTFISFSKSKEAQNANLMFDLQTLEQKFYETYATFLMKPEGSNLFNNTFGGHVKKLKTFLKWCEIDKQLQVDKRYNRFRVLTEEKEVICLTETDINLLYNYKPKARAHADSIDNQKYIDFTVFSFLTGLRISDVKKSGGVRRIGDYLMGKATKTKNKFKIPLNYDKRIIQILEKYDYNLGLFSDVEYNKRIKIILKDFLEEHNLHQKPIKITRYKLTESFTTAHQFYELYSSHCNRRGFVTNAYSKGLSIKWIKEVLGTKSDKELEKYLKIDTSSLELELNKVQYKVTD